MTTAIGQFRHVVSLVAPGPGVEDPDGGWGGDAWVPLDPPTWHCSIQAASLRDLQRLSGGVLSTTATHVIRGRYHPQLTRAARIQFGDRIFDVESVHDQDERRIELEVIVHEQLGAVAPAALPYADQVLADGASAYWRLGDLGGTIALDRVGFAHGTISGGVTLQQPGAIMDSNAAMAFDGTTGKIITSAPVTIPLVCTIEVWIKTAGPIPGQRAIVYDGQGGGGTIYVGVNTGRLMLVSTNFSTTVTTVDDGQWHHVVLVLSGGRVDFYIDGQFNISRTEGRTVVPTLPLWIAGTDVGEFWAGFVDDVAIYPLALTATQIAAHYAAATGG